MQCIKRTHEVTVIGNYGYNKLKQSLICILILGELMINTTIANPGLYGHAQRASGLNKTVPITRGQNNNQTTSEGQHVNEGKRGERNAFKKCCITFTESRRKKRVLQQSHGNQSKSGVGRVERARKKQPKYD